VWGLSVDLRLDGVERNGEVMKYIGSLLMIGMMFLVGCGHGIDSGDGKKIGQVIQMGRHGWMCPTYEGSIVRGGFNTGSGVAGGTFYFTVEDPKLVERLFKAMEQQQEIEVTYKKVSFSGPCTCESDHFVTSFEVLKDTTPSVTVNPAAVDPKEAKRKELMQQLQELDKK
jgi:hypothetical protein